jgi:hypothetical protein
MESNHETSKTPSSILLAAAMLGLLGGACGSEKARPEADPPLCGTAASSSSGGSTSSTGTGAGGASSSSSGSSSSSSSSGSGGPVVLSEVEGTKTFSELKAACDTRGGFWQLHAACAGSNSCAGFSYGDWDPGVVSEHTCAGVNGCNGISCVVPPKDSGKTGKQIYEDALPETGPRSCTNCHAVWSDDGPDMKKFKLYLLPGSPRNATNWLDFPAATQARIVAFGKHGLLDDGSAYSNMAAYHKIYSRAEIERVVEYIRTSLELVPTTIKVAD